VLALPASATGPSARLCWLCHVSHKSRHARIAANAQLRLPASPHPVPTSLLDGIVKRELDWLAMVDRCSVSGYRRW
jgi:hypothetical protein